jgi:TfoX/Sxy family transcriptional regulator of competence genes
MAYSESMADRIRRAFGRRRGIEEKKMFGGLGFMLKGNLLVGVWQSSLLVRLGPDQTEMALKQAHVSQFVMKGRASKGWVLVAPEGVEHDDQLNDWIRRAEEFVATLPAK